MIWNNDSYIFLYILHKYFYMIEIKIDILNDVNFWLLQKDPSWKFTFCIKPNKKIENHIYDIKANQLSSIFASSCMASMQSERILFIAHCRSFTEIQVRCINMEKKR